MRWNRVRANALGCLMAATLSQLAVAQSVAPPSGQKSLAATLNVYAFPTKGQAPDQQSKDEAECYQWAVQNTGTDPFNLQKQAQAQQAQTEAQKQAAQGAGQGAGAAGAVKGAAAGALIGSISGDAGQGAAIGATAGVVAGRRRGRAAQEQATQQAEAAGQQAQAATADQMNNFKKAFGVCLEAKGYMVK